MMKTAELDFDDILGDGIAGDADATANEANETASDPSDQENQDATELSSVITRRRATVPAGLFCFDLETIPDYSREHLFDLLPLPELGPRTEVKKMMSVDELLSGSLPAIKEVLKSRRPVDEYLVLMQNAERESKKPRAGLFEAVDEVINEGKAVESAIEARRKKMATSPEMCRIVSAAWSVGDGAVSVDNHSDDDPIALDFFEKNLLEKFWQAIKTAKIIVGFNHIAFDLPVIYVRSALLGVEPTRRIDLKPWGGEVVDLMAARWPRGNAMKLKDLAKSLGLEIPAGDVDGSQVEELYQTDPAKLAEYNRSDVEITREIFLMYRGFFW